MVLRKEANGHPRYLHVKVEEEAEAQRASQSDSVTPGRVKLRSDSQPPCDLQEAPPPLQYFPKDLATHPYAISSL